MRVGIFTYHRSHNYGAYLQAYSLSNAINDIEGVSCELINYNLSKEDEVYKKKKWKRPIYFFKFLKQDKIFNEEQKHQLLSGNLILDDNYEKILQYADEKYDVVIVGSDEIWRIASRGFPNAYWLPGKHKFIKMSYAASGRNSNQKLTDEVLKKMKSIYADFNYIGVRDNITGEQVKKSCPEVQIHRNCDPSFLYKNFKNKKNLKENICKKWKLNPNKKLIAVMYDRPNVITNLRKLLGKDYEFICITRPMWNANKNLCTVTPFEWVDIIGGCDYLISSYFHGMLFAVNQNTPFIVIDRRANKSNLETSKLYDFLTYTKMEDRYKLASELNEDAWSKIAEQIKLEIKNGADFSEVIDNQKKLFEEFKEILMGFANE